MVEIFGTTTVEGDEPLSGTPVAPAAASLRPAAEVRTLGRSGGFAATDPVTTLSGTLNGTSARALTLPESASTSSSLTR